jgi:hypothetical protein
VETGGTTISLKAADRSPSFPTRLFAPFCIPCVRMFSFTTSFTTSFTLLFKLAMYLPRTYSRLSAYSACAYLQASPLCRHTHCRRIICRIQAQFPPVSLHTLYAHTNLYASPPKKSALPPHTLPPHTLPPHTTLTLYAADYASATQRARTHNTHTHTTYKRTAYSAAYTRNMRAEYATEYAVRMYAEMRRRMLVCGRV